MTEPALEGADVIHVLPTTEVAEDADPWQLLEAGQAVAVERLDRVGNRSGTVFPATSSIARALQPVLGTFEGSGKNLYRVYLPTGASINDLVPALGGGYRGMVRNGKSISGHVRLVRAGVTTAKVGTAAVVAVAVAADYMAQRELSAKLEAIQRGVDHLLQRIESEDLATLEVAAETIVEAQAAVAGEASPPKSLGLDATTSKLRHYLARERLWIEKLEAAAAEIAEMSAGGKLDKDGVPIDTVEKLIGMEGLLQEPWRYAARVANYYRALVLDSHLAVLAAAEAQLSSGATDLEEFKKVLSRRLRVNSLRQEQLVSATEALAREPITVRYLRGGLREAHTFERVVTAVAFGIRSSAQMPQLVDAKGRQELEVEVLESGDIRLLNGRETHSTR